MTDITNWAQHDIKTERTIFCVSKRAFSCTSLVWSFYILALFRKEQKY